jgi:hypothetical protein
MNQKEFKAFVVEEEGLIAVKSKLVIYEGDLLIKFITPLNYKDALSSIGNKGVTRKYPYARN